MMNFQPPSLATTKPLFLFPPSFASLFPATLPASTFVQNLQPFLFQSANFPAFLAAQTPSFAVPPSLVSSTPASPVSANLTPTLQTGSVPVQKDTSSTTSGPAASSLVKAAIVPGSSSQQAISALTGSKILKSGQTKIKMPNSKAAREEKQASPSHVDEKRDSPQPLPVLRKRKQASSPAPRSSPTPDTLVDALGVTVEQRKLPERKRKPNSKFDSKEYSTPTSSPPSSPEHFDEDFPEELDESDAKPVKRHRNVRSSPERERPLFSASGSLGAGVKPHKPHVNIRHVDQLRLSGMLPQRRRALSFSEDSEGRPSTGSTRKSSRVGREFQADIPELNILRTLREGSWDGEDEDTTMEGHLVQSQSPELQLTTISASPDKADRSSTAADSSEVQDAVDSLMNLLAVAASSASASSSASAALEPLALPVPSPQLNLTVPSVVATNANQTSTPSDSSDSSSATAVVASSAQPQFSEPPILPLMPNRVSPAAASNSNSTSSSDNSNNNSNTNSPDHHSNEADMKRQSPSKGLAAILSVAMEAESKPSASTHNSNGKENNSPDTNAPNHDSDNHNKNNSDNLDKSNDTTAAMLEAEEDADEGDELDLPPTPLSPSGSDMCWPEAVRGIRKQKQKLQYLIKWRGFKTLSWEPADSFADDGAFQDLVESFKQRRANRSRTRSRRSRYPRSRKNALDVAADADGQ